VGDERLLMASVPSNLITDLGSGICRVEIVSDTLAFSGRSFGRIGTYRKITGKAFGELDPADSLNTVITDLTLAPLNSRGRVEYWVEICVLRPSDPAKGNGKLFFEVTNRGNKRLGAFNRSCDGNDPTTSEDAGGAFLMEQGYAIAWSGWDPSAQPGDNRLLANFPIARYPDGSSVTGPSYEYLVFDETAQVVAPLAYQAASSDKSNATLTVRARLSDAPVLIDSSDWEYASDQSIRLLPAGTPFLQSAIYEFTYTATNPNVAGIGFAAIRDVIFYLRRESGTDGSLLGGGVKSAICYAVSQAARFMNDFIALGFNEDSEGTRIFDGVLTWLGAGAGVGLNLRFAQLARTERMRQNHFYHEAQFPFAFNKLTDGFTGVCDGRGERCERAQTWPRVLAVNSSNEYWAKAGSLLHTDCFGKEIPELENVRFYLLSSLEHGVAGSPPNFAGFCQQPRNGIDPSPALRALFIALDEWLGGIEPPVSAIPKIEDDSAAFIEPTPHSPLGIGIVPKAMLGWPDIPGVSYTGVATVRNLMDFGSQAQQGVLTIVPPHPTGMIYPAFVPKVDADGNDIAGIRLPPVAVPTATYTGWSVRAEGCGGQDGGEHFGQTIPFAITREEREASGDPRPSMQERYRDGNDYVNAVSQAAQELVRRRLLLQDDADAYVQAARNEWMSR